jgi:hypothetical protein
MARRDLKAFQANGHGGANRVAAGDGVEPLQVMLEAMRAAHARGDLDKAHAYAKDAAPYVHPALTAVGAGRQAGSSINP